MKNFKQKKLLPLMTVILITAVAIFPIKASAAWRHDSNGWWNTEGISWSTGWRSIDNNWYYFGSDGYMKTSWILDGGKWYYTASSGAMQTGWLFNNNLWYYLSTSGDMKTGLIEINNKTYYLDESGAMKTGNITINGTNYTFAATGEKVNTIDSKIADATKITITDSKISDATKTTITDSTTTKTDTDSTDDDSSSSSGGSGGGSSSSNNDKDDSTTSYENLYGTWTIKSCISQSSNLSELQKTLASSAAGEQFTITEKNITMTILGITKTATNLTFKESTINASDFSKKWGLEVDGNTIKCIHITSSEGSAYAYITDNKTYVLLKESLFEIEQ